MRNVLGDSRSRHSFGVTSDNTSSAIVRTRFAPSPTGLLHLGNIRSALYPWAFARKRRGVFILRIEDTDIERTTPEAIQTIIDSMAWLGLDYDEGPFFQTERMERYQAVLKRMIAEGTAYYCYTTPEELEAMRTEQSARGEKPKYDRRWRPDVDKQLPSPPSGVSPVIRFRNPIGGTVAWNDAVKGLIEIANEELDDLVIARSDGIPTYNFCVVVDDLDMAITHVIRGDDHVNNTPRQINVLKALGGSAPIYAHLPTVLTPDGEKLSKRHGAKSVPEYRNEGYLPDAVINYLARLGWSHGNDEIFSRTEFLEWFDLSGLTPSPGRFDPDKLRWLNHEHLKRMTAEDLGIALRPFLMKNGIGPDNGPDAGAVAELLRDRHPILSEIAGAANYFYVMPVIDKALLQSHLSAAAIAALKKLVQEFSASLWQREVILAAIKATAAAHQLKPPQLMMPLRLTVAGTLTTPAIDAVLALLGREETIKRMDQALKDISADAAS